MVIDTSALVAILFGEPDADRMVRAIAKDATRLLAAPTLVEASAVMLARSGPGGEIGKISKHKKSGGSRHDDGNIEERRHHHRRRRDK